MAKNLYIIIVVCLRLAGLWLIVVTALSMFMVNLLSGGFGRISAGLPLIPLFIPLLGGLALWFCAKAVARVVTADLE